ncbi:gliding motility-associated C-terminal domain-containing protein [Flavobacterium wongokense]|uniref:Ig-like domain-containing protein n=1 Tax=Flavobacterium wongokense TaxID=2910674 RepID=UPI001F3C51C5|nr:gliding motility-associated C-terminal domain-containing protein [Flavobacterium sp. WG47]MCF6132062.1 gliding motility-associated C-terminal domain-containing protein [Flavobacterium sp. WG47]
MDCNTIFFRKIVSSCLVILTLFFLFPGKSYAQSIPVYASSIVSEDNVDAATNSIDGNMASRARIRASSGIAIGIGAYSGHLEIEFPTLVPANTTTFVKIQTDDNLLPALLSGSLGGLLSDILGTALIGNQEFSVQAKNGSTVVLQGNSYTINDFATSRLRIVTNANNDYFIALTPSQAYKSIRLTNRLGSLVGLGNTKRLDVYEAFYIGTPDICGGASFTSFDGTGLNLDLLGLGGAGVTNPNYVLDSNPNNFSRLSLGILAVAASVEQTVYFDGTSQPTDQFFVKLKVDPALLALGVANNIHIVAANGPNVIQTVNLNSLLNLDLLTLLQGNQVVTIPFSPNATVNRITVRYSSLLNVQLTQSLDLYGITRAPAQPVISDPFTLNPITCSGSTATLVAQSGPGTELVWYSQAQGGTAITTVNSGQPFVTSILTQDTSFYVASKRTGCPEESLRVRVDVEVITLPTADDITIPSSLNACNGSIILSPASSIGGAAFRYYKDQLKSQEITTGYTGDAGVTYAVNNATGELTITGLTAINSPYHYFISLTVGGLCENAANTLKEVVVNYSSTLSLSVSAAIQGCGSVNLRDAILNFDNSSDIVYHFYDSTHTPITAELAANIQTGGIYYIQSSSLSGSCSSSEEQVTVTINPEPTLVITNTNLVVNLGTSVTLQATSNASITWYDSNGNALPSNTYGPFTTASFYTFTAIASNGNCSKSQNVFVTVIDPANCPVLTERVYADSQSWSSIITGGVANANLSIDANPRTHSTIITGLGLLGVGTTWQTLQWNQTVPAGTPLSVKLGSEYSGLVLAGAYSVVGTKRNTSGIPIDIGFLQPVSGSLLDLLPGENTFEFTFVPSDFTGPKDYDGVRIIVGSVLSVAQNVKVYEAYYDRAVAQVACNPEDVKDVFYGAVDLGVGVTTATVGVANPYDAVDADDATYATMFSGLGVLAAADLTISFRTPTLTGDSLNIILSRPSTILNLGLLTGFTVQMYMGNTPVGLPLDNTSSLLQLTLLNGGSEAALTVHPQTQPYDRIKIRFGGVASVLDLLRVHDIQRFADTSVVDADLTNTIEACPGDTLRLNILPEDCATFIWYDAAVGGNIVSTGTSFTLPSILAAGTYTYYIQPVRFGCETYARGTVTVIVGQTAPPTAISQILINGSTNPVVCTTTGNVNLQAVLNSTITITNPVFHWYSFDGTSQNPIVGQSSSTLALTGLTPGSYTYYVGVSSDEYCETAQPDRATVTITILPFTVATDITANDALFCLGNNAAITPTTILPNPQFFWFFSNDNSQPIANGSVVGAVTFTIGTDGTLTVSGLVAGVYTYYVGLTSDTSCLNQAGDFKPVVITVSGGTTPTTISASQSFCMVNNPTISDIQVNETGVTWYDAPTNGNVLAASTPLTNGGIYYASIIDGTGCPSSTRLAITTTVNPGTTPTTTSASQSFCLVNNPTIADIQVNGAGVLWYDAPVNGNILTSTTALTNGGIYYASIIDGTGCASSIRLAVTTTVNPGTTPTTSSASQSFCLVNNPTIADIQVNETGVTWYDAPVNGNIITSTTALTNGGIYYASIIDGTGCASSIRLAVTTTVNPGTTPTTISTTQSFCLVNNPTIADIQVNETGVTWYDAAVNGSVLASTTTLTNGGIYYASIIDGTGCASSIRLAVTTTVNPGTTPTTTSTSQSFCSTNNPTIADIQVNESGVTWYDAATNGNILAASTVLTNGGIYYASIVDGTGCASSIRLAVTTTINNGTTPTTTNNSQSFCLVNNPTIADIQVNETGVTWYDAATNGNVLASTTTLTNGGIYYASITDGNGCISSVRLMITTTINPGTTPTTTSTSQSFCLVDSPTLTNIQVNETGVTWYDAAVNGNALPATTSLANGGIYYASILDGTGCASSIRLAVTTTVNGGTTPTATNPSQSFCQSASATLADVQVNETGVTWYDAPAGGNVLPSTTLLADGGVYYASIIDGSGCASSIRLMVNTTFTPNTPAVINGGTNPACAFDEVTYTTNPGMSNYVWTVINGIVIAGGQPTDDYVTVSWTSVGPAQVTVDFINSCSGHSVRELALSVVSCSDLLITKTVDNPTPNIDTNVVFTITVTNSGPNHILNVSVNEPLPSGYSFVNATSSVGSYNSGVWEIPRINSNETVTMLLTARVLPTGDYMNTVSIGTSDPIDTDLSNNDASITTTPLCLIVYNEFSPNDDGSNEFFIVDCIENYPNNKLHVYNRYGTLVYDRSHYLNDWNGTANVSGTINVNDKLPTGTYYYVLDVGVDNIVKTGWLSIAR